MLYLPLFKPLYSNPSSYNKKTGVHPTSPNWCKHLIGKHFPAYFLHTNEFFCFDFEFRKEVKIIEMTEDNQRKN